RNIFVIFQQKLTASSAGEVHLSFPEDPSYALAAGVRRSVEFEIRPPKAAASILSVYGVVFGPFLPGKSLLDSLPRNNDPRANAEFFHFRRKSNPDFHRQ